MCRVCWVAGGEWFKQLVGLSREPYFSLNFAALIFIKICLCFPTALYSHRDEDWALFGKIVVWSLIQ